MATTTNITQGLAVKYKNQDWIVSFAQFVNPGKGAAFTRAKLKNLKTGQVVENTFRSGESIETIDVVRNKCQYLYNDSSDFYFMDNETFEQFALSADIIGDQKDFLLDNTECYSLYIDGTPMSIQLPPKMTFTVISTPPGVKGDTATGGSKEAIIDSGATIKVPLFIKEGERIIVNTEDRSYVSKDNS
ncbi:elongation factor P [Candidatus Peregrinibacteria bacterium HGW-Peregrinibacteria-1]|jgi:elongation factor P|nr:MAG: elongation factor P [Candidatus Peregrinibacteria bacterium HGW-Peregrinibacteria-1]